jgi:Tol biopolymer transport system component
VRPWGCVVGLGALAACGRVGFDPTPPPPDAAPFGPAQLVSELSLPDDNDDDPTLTTDQLELVFCSSRSGNGDIYRAVRSSTAEPWGPPTLVAELAHAATETTTELSNDGLTLRFGSDRAGGAGAIDMWITTRPSRSDPWAAPVPETSINTIYDEHSGFETADGSLLAFHSNRPGLGAFDLYVAPREGTGWGPAMRLDGVSSAGDEGNPFFTEDLLALYYDAGPIGGETDLHVATRLTAEQTFATRRLEELSGPTGEEDPWVSPDGRTIYFARYAGDGTQDIYVAIR